MDSESTLRFILRFFGTMSLLAIPFIFVPYSVMDGIHRDMLRLGALPDEPIVGYLARSLSAFYALLGAIMWKVSFDVRHYRSFLTFLSGAIALFGAALLFIDRYEGLPALWQWWEGPLTIVLGAVTLGLSRRLRPS